MNFSSSLIFLFLTAFIFPALGQRPPERPDFKRGEMPPMLERKKVKLLARFDQNKNGRLDREERQMAREDLKKNPPKRGFGGRMPGGFGPQKNQDPPQAGQPLSPKEVRPIRSKKLYDTRVLRTLFIDFENNDWEAELEAFHDSDVEVPATLTVDGKVYPNVGIHFRGMSSYMMVGTGQKRSLNLSMNFMKRSQRLYGFKTLNLLNSSGDGSFLSSAIYSHIARKHLPAPRVNLVRVVINGENWGIYTNQEQFNSDFIKAHYGTREGARWKVPGSPNGRGGLEYLGDDLAPYKERYRMKSGDTDDWHALKRLCKTLSQTPPDQLEKALAPLMDLDEVLWFLALDCGLMNSDGYWTRASDYSIYRDSKGKFHFFPYDMNEAFREAHHWGPGGPRGRDDHAKEGLKLDPLVGLDDDSKPLRSKLLAVPALRRLYLAKIKQLAQVDLDWKNLGPVVAQYRNLIEQEIAADHRKLSTTEAFLNLTADQPEETTSPRDGYPLRKFADQRRKDLLSEKK